MNIVQLSITLHCFIWGPHLPNFTTKVACICIPKNHVNCIGFLHLMSKSYGFGMTGPLDESISCFLIRVDPWVHVPIAFRGLHILAFRGLHVLILGGQHVLTFRGLHVLTFRGLHVLAFSGLHVLAFRGMHVLAFRGLHILAFIGLHVLAFRGRHTHTFRGPHILTFRGLHAHQHDHSYTDMDDIAT